MRPGIVYIISNPAMPNLVKIGKTDRENLSQGLPELFGTGLPFAFECHYACKVQDVHQVEKALHLAFHNSRVNPQREFFEIEPDQAITILKLLAIKDVTPQTKSAYEKEVDPGDIAAGEAYKKMSRPPLNFREMNIPVGSVLNCIESDDSVEVISDRKVKFKGEETSLTNVIRNIFKIDFAIQPTGYWTYKGRKLTEIYEETYGGVLP